MPVRANPNRRVLSVEEADRLGVLITLPLTQSAVAEIRRVLAAKAPGGRAGGRNRGLASTRRGGAVTGSVAAPSLRLATGGAL